MCQASRAHSLRTIVIFIGDLARLRPSGARLRSGRPLGMGKGGAPRRGRAWGSRPARSARLTCLVWRLGGVAGALPALAASSGWEAPG